MIFVRFVCYNMFQPYHFMFQALFASLPPHLAIARHLVPATDLHRDVRSREVQLFVEPGTKLTWRGKLSSLGAKRGLKELHHVLFELEPPMSCRCVSGSHWCSAKFVAWPWTLAAAESAVGFWPDPHLPGHFCAKDTWLACLQTANQPAEPTKPIFHETEVWWLVCWMTCLTLSYFILIPSHCPICLDHLDSFGLAENQLSNLRENSVPESGFEDVCS